jgi:O-antigen/teichoic acid export membrane protein
MASEPQRHGQGDAAHDAMSAPPTSIDGPLGLFKHSVTPRLTLFGLATDRLRVWGPKSALSLIDQALTSGAGFAVNLFLARWLSPSLYGAFAVAFAASLFVAGFHTVLVLEPLSVFGPARHASNLLAYFRVQIRLHFLLVGALSVCGLLAALALRFVAPKSAVVPAAAASAIALPFFLLLWLARRMCYVVQRPSLAIAGSVTYLAGALIGLFALRYFGKISPFSVFLLIGVMSMFASAILLWLLKRGRGFGPRIILSIHRVLKENWSYGRWLVASTALFTVSTQTQTFLAAAILGLGAAGILRAMQIPSLVMGQVTTATGLLVLPAFSYDFGKGLTGRMRQKATFVSLSLAGGALCFAAVLVVLAGSAEHLLYGEKYALYAWLIPVLALMPVCAGIGMGYSMALRAFQKPHFDLVCNAVAAPVGLVSAILFMHWWGVAGAAASMVLASATSAAVVFVSYRFLWAGLEKSQKERIATSHG